MAEKITPTKLEILLLDLIVCGKLRVLVEVCNCLHDREMLARNLAAEIIEHFGLEEA